MLQSAVSSTSVSSTNVGTLWLNDCKVEQETCHLLVWGLGFKLWLTISADSRTSNTIDNPEELHGIQVKMGPSTESKVGKRVTTVFIPTLTKFQKDQDVALKVPVEFHRFSYTTSGALPTRGTVMRNWREVRSASGLSSAKWSTRCAKGVEKFRSTGRHQGQGAGSTRGGETTLQ